MTDLARHHARSAPPLPSAEGRGEGQRRRIFQAPPAAQIRAFTLLELLVALAIVGLLSGVLYAALHIGFAARASVQRTMEPRQRADIVTNFLCRDLESALPPTGTLSGAFIGVDGQDDRGQPGDDLLFCAAVSGPSVALATDIRQIEYIIMPDGDDHVLMRRVTSNLLSPVTVTPDDEVLCRGVQSFNVQYYDGTNWYDNWDSTQPASLTGPSQSNALPQAVQVTFALEPSSPGKPPLTVSRIIQLPCAVPATTTSGSTSAFSTGGTP
jgi:prepilin-type N-terminal cleavage/methylation domain-containing protein